MLRRFMNFGRKRKIYNRYQPIHFPVSVKRLCLEELGKPEPKKSLWDENEPLTAEKLKFMLVSQNNLARKLVSPKLGLKELLSSEILSNEIIELLLKIFEKMCREENYDNTEMLDFVLADIVDSNFLYTVTQYFDFFFNFNGKSDSEKEKLLGSCLYLIKVLLEKHPKTSVNKLSILYKIVEKCLLDINLELSQLKEFSTFILELIDKVKLRNKRYQETFKKTTKYMMLKHKEEPPDDFREISVFPTTNDIHLKEDPFVRTNLVNSSYSSIDHYLDVQFRLLREDFIRPLREGIMEFFQSDNSRFDRKQRIKCYDEVYIVKPVASQQGIMHEIKFHVKSHQNRKSFWNKKLKYGNVVCLSSDKFQNDILFAIITERDPNKLSEGTLFVQFKAEDQEVNDIFFIDMTKEYSMVETDAYFEAYRYVLEGLQEIIWDMPIKKYIVDCNAIIKPPTWVEELADKFDITPIMKNTYSLREKNEKMMINVLEPLQWPTETELGLDVSQKNALQAALTNELAIIQGPPGTGKTYLGLMIMKLLLKNLPNCPTKYWPIHKSYEEITTPRPMHPLILVVCYTNHALDQFLEGITEFSLNEKIVRVGGRCNNPNLEKFLLKNVKKAQVARNRNEIFSQLVYDYLKSYRNLEAKIKFYEKVLDSSSDTVIKLEILKSVIAEDFLTEFYNKHKQLDDQNLVKWLEIASSIDQTALNYPHVIQEMLLEIKKRSLEQSNCRQKGVEISVTVDHSSQTRKVNTTKESPVISRACEEQRVQYRQDAIISKLNSVVVPYSSFLWLKSKGYHDLEIRCAFYILGDNKPLTNIQQWLEYKKSEHALKPKVDTINEDAFDDENSFETEADFHDRNQFYEDMRERNPEMFSDNEIAVTYRCEDKDSSVNGVTQFYKFRKVIGNDEIMSKNEICSLPRIHKLNLIDRWRLYQYWIEELKVKLKEKIQNLQAESHKVAERLTIARQNEDFQVLQKANVIGMTTTGAAKHRSVIQRLPVKIVIVEEAAEVLEAHIVTAMPRTTEHLILIGDHQQLQPSTAVYELATKYNLNVSLFERLINNKLPFTKLSLQHRMRPQIADLIRPSIYNELSDDDSVNKYENVRGIQKNVFFITHEVEETSLSGLRSKVNEHESEFLVELYKYLLNQGYQKHQITFLTMYTGQVLNLKKQISDHDVKITSVDNYQGEENDIILLSLVRSNERDEIGFLKVKNRICVALSRAKIGLYCIGNFKILQKNKMWEDIVKKLQKNDCFGDSLPLITGCKMHPSYGTPVKHAMDFPSHSHGGCGEPCKFRLECGHVCPKLCHPLTNHLYFFCQKECPKKCRNEHPCVKFCSENCGLCQYKMNRILPKCKHILPIPCHVDPNTFVCPLPCEKTLKCGHPCKENCGKSCSKTCLVKVRVDLECGHMILMECSRNNSSYKKRNLAYCPEPCTETLECGHACTGTCSGCYQGRMHKFCKKKCTRMNLCGHPCQDDCRDQCSPCQESCEVKCEHSSCSIPCGEPCSPCIEKCNWACEHHQCSKLCGEPCDRPPCNKPCHIIHKKCRHPCIGLCGETCPNLCRICDKKKVTEFFLGGEDEEDARFFELECGHIFTYENLDRWMNQDINATSDSENPVDKTIQLKECPKCKTVIRKSRRYKSIINEQLSLMNEVKEKINSKEYIENKKSDLVRKLDSRGRHRLNKQRILSAFSLSEIALLELLVDMESNLSHLKHDIRHSSELSKEKEEELLCEISTLSKFMVKAEKYHKQIVSDIRCEYKRIIAKKQASMAHQKYSSSGKTDKNLSDNIDIILTLSDGIFRYDEKKELTFNELFQTIKTQFVELGIILTMQERNMIIKAMDFQNRGHWFKCKNGHVYAIGDCGGAQQKSICPECKEEIGGQQHRLVEGNSVAREMDGATRSAYDEAAELNLVPENLRFD